MAKVEFCTLVSTSSTENQPFQESRLQCLLCKTARGKSLLHQYFTNKSSIFELVLTKHLFNFLSSILDKTLLLATQGLF